MALGFGGVGVPPVLPSLRSDHPLLGSEMRVQLGDVGCPQG